MNSDILELTKQAAEAISEASAIWIGAGAGMGVDSGLPDFRGNEGFWNAYPPFRKLGLDFYDLANPSWFGSDPARAWGFYGHRRNLYRATQPHDGFTKLLNIAQRTNNYFVFTSNVDGHFERAGFDSNKIVECHGSINYTQCSSNCIQEIWASDPTEVEIEEETMRAAEPFPKCKHCGGTARPNILMFGDSSWQPARTDIQCSRYSNWLQENRPHKITAIEFGAGTAIPTVRYEAESRANSLIRINPREAHGPTGTISIELGAQEAIERIVDAL